MPTERRERNQEIYREVNERIRAVTARFGPVGDEWGDFLCECGDRGCREHVRLMLVEYEQIPRTGSYFIVKPGHDRDTQRVVRRRRSYLVVIDADEMDNRLHYVYPFSYARNRSRLTRADLR
jgi:hypothetical protein